MAVLWLKLGERDFLVQEGELPVLLFDDIFSELDEKHKSEVLKLINDQTKRGGQVVMTTADENAIPSSKDWKIIRL
jgi:recombinational DNA repair ATPase RecF